MNLPYDLDNEIKGYCKLNNITDIDKFIIKLIKKGFTSEKYGSIPEEVVIKKNSNIKKEPITPKVEIIPPPSVVKNPTPKEKKKVEKPKVEIKTVEKNKGLYDED